MTITAEQSHSRMLMLSAPCKLSGSRMVLRGVSRIGAATMALVVLFVWFAPGAGWEIDMVLFKMMVSLFAGFAGISFWQNSLPPLPPTVEIDVAGGELRLIRDGAASGAQVLERCAFADLHSVELEGWHITFWGQGNRLLAEIRLSNAMAHATLLAALRNVGKLA